jgi:hypothetical protein
LIFLAFVCPLAIYLIALGLINRRRHPLLVSGTWDLIGMLFAASGFLLCTGPGLLSGRDEGWRKLWLLGDSEGASLVVWQRLWVYLAYLYFLVVVGGSALLFWRQRRITSIYNISAGQLQQALDKVCEKLGLHPVRSGNLLLFGLSLGASPATASGKALLQGPHYRPAEPKPLPTGVTETLAPPRLSAAGSSSDLTAQAGILEIDPFPFMSHVTLRWDPADSPLRQEVEHALADQMARSETIPHDLGGWMIVIGLLLLAVVVFFAFLWVVVHFPALHR